MGRYDVKMSGRKFDYIFLPIESSYSEKIFRVFKKDQTEIGKVVFSEQSCYEDGNQISLIKFKFGNGDLKLEINANKQFNDFIQNIEEEELIKGFETILFDASLFPLD